MLALDMEGTCALPNAVVERSSQLQNRLGPQLPGLVTGPTRDLGLRSRRVDVWFAGESIF